MNCYLHPDTAAVAFCRSCGKPLCAVCQRPFEGTVYCQDHAPAASGYINPQEFQAKLESDVRASSYASSGYAGTTDPNSPGVSNPYGSPPPQVPPVQTSPVWAFILGCIPGVGAIFNGQYLKGLVHAIILGLLFSLANSTQNTAGQPLIVLLTIVFWLYMPFEAYHTAKKRQLGIPVEEWSSIMAQNRYGVRAPIGPVILIIIGILFLLDTLRVIEFREIGRFWPVILIVAGAYMLYNRVAGPTVAARNFHPTYTPPRSEQGTPNVAEGGHE